MTDGVYLAPIDLDDLGFPDEEIPFLRNDVQFAEFFNLIIECINALRLCGSVTVPTPQGEQDPAGTYPRPLTRTEVNFPTEPLPYFGNHTQQARIRNFFVDAVNALRRCYLSASPTTQGIVIDGAVYLPPPTIASIGFPDSPIPTNLFGNHVQGKRLYDYLVDALNRLRNCCAVHCSADDASGSFKAVKAIKTADDLATLFNGFEIWGQDEHSNVVGGTVRYESVWARLRFRVSSNYPLYIGPTSDGSRGMYFISLAAHLTGGVTVSEALIATGTGSTLSGAALYGDELTVSHQVSPNALGSPSAFESLLGNVDDLARTGTVKEFILYAGKAFDEFGVQIPNVYRVAVWAGDATDTGLSATKARGDDFAAWPLGEAGYASFLADTVTNPNYEDGSRATSASDPGTTYSTHHMPGDLNGYFMEFFDDEAVPYPYTPPVDQPNRNRISQVDIPAGATMRKFYDVIKPTSLPFYVRQIYFMRHKIGAELVPVGEDEMCYECLSWEYENGDGAGAGQYDPYGVESAPWNLAGQSPPANDLLANAQVISGASGSVLISQFNTDRAQTERSENHRTSFGGSLWYEWTAPANGTAVFDTESSDPSMDTLLGVYTGSSFALTEVGFNDDDVGTLSKVTFAATMGTVYKIQVGRYSGTARGPLVLSWSLA